MISRPKSLYLHIRLPAALPAGIISESMQERHENAGRYFDECARTCARYYLPWLKSRLAKPLGDACRVLEAGCDKGGNLKPFAEAGCRVVGIDLNAGALEAARELFEARGLEGVFLWADILEFAPPPNHLYDLIILRDVIEHVEDQPRLMARLAELLAPDGVLFVAYPPWRMPFGGHQQMAVSRFAAHCPWLHLLPGPLYPWALRLAGETPGKIAGLLEIRDTRISVRKFRRLAAGAGLRTVTERFFLINPHYEAKFGLKPRCLPRLLEVVPWLRDFFATTCFCLLQRQE